MQKQFVAIVSNWFLFFSYPNNFPYPEMIHNKYFDLIDQSYYFPQEGFDLEKTSLFLMASLWWCSLKNMVLHLKWPIFPKLVIKLKSKNFFNRSIKSTNYGGRYFYCYCTKCCHFSYVLEEVLQHDVQIETSSAFDIELILNLYKQGKIDQSKIIVNNGFKTKQYLENISELVNDGFENVIPVLDNKYELSAYESMMKKPCKMGVRMATEEEPMFEFYTSRLGIRSSEIVQFCKDNFTNHSKFTLHMLHFLWIPELRIPRIIGVN